MTARHCRKRRTGAAARAVRSRRHPAPGSPHGGRRWAAAGRVPVARRSAGRWTPVRRWRRCVPPRLSCGPGAPSTAVRGALRRWRAVSRQLAPGRVLAQMERSGLLATVLGEGRTVRALPALAGKKGGLCPHRQVGRMAGSSAGAGLGRAYPTGFGPVSLTWPDGHRWRPAFRAAGRSGDAVGRGCPHADSHRRRRRGTCRPDAPRPDAPRAGACGLPWASPGGTASSRRWRRPARSPSCPPGRGSLTPSGRAPCKQPQRASAARTCSGVGAVPPRWAGIHQVSVASLGRTG